MCKWCDNPKCTITKEQVLQRGPILESDVTEIMHPASEYGPATYAFAGQPCFDSYSALIPDANEENPHAYLRFRFDEDEGAPDGWTCTDVENPLSWQTEREIVLKVIQKNFEKTVLRTVQLAAKDANAESVLIECQFTDEEVEESKQTEVKPPKKNQCKYVQANMDGTVELISDNGNVIYFPNTKSAEGVLSLVRDLLDMMEATENENRN